MLYRFVTGLTRAQKQVAFVLLDGLAILVALMIAIPLATQGPQAALSALWPLGMVLAVSGVVLGWAMGLTRIKLNAYEMRGVTRTVSYALGLGVMNLFLAPLLHHDMPLGTHVLFALLVLFVSAGWRVMLRHVTQVIYHSGPEVLRVLIYGAGTTGQQLAAALRHGQAVRAVAFIDDNPTVQSQVIAGLRVHAPSRIAQLVEEKRIDRVVLAMPSITPPDLARLRHRLRTVGAEVHALPSFAAMVGDGVLQAQMTPVPIPELLGRSRLEQELPGVSHTYSGRRILVTGAGGSIGSELCRQLVDCRPACLVLVDHSELALYNVERALREIDAGVQTVAVLGSVLDGALMAEVLRDHRIDVVLHAAAYKHLPLVEENPLAGLQNNVLGTKVLADAARRCGVERFILVSSDKAVRPTNVMGASKRLAELVVQDLAARTSGTRFSMVRFGNVLGSSGSVIPLFEAQIARGGPVTLTHTDVTRYFMTIPEAARLVLLTGSFARGGDVFVLDMGNPVSIRRIARQMIEAAGYSVRSDDTPEGDIEMRITGLRPGEKLHEELLISADMVTTPHPKIRRAKEQCLSEFEIATALKDLRHAIDTRDTEAARAVIARWVESAPDSAVAVQRR